jgi:hypothetical protein
MRKETYYKNKLLFTLNYMMARPMYHPLNVPIDLCMKGIHGKQKFFTYYSQDVGIRGTNVVSSIHQFTVYKTWDGKIMSKIFPPREKGLFGSSDNFERFDEYIKTRDKK